jgi:hypothetical protein
MNPSQQQINSAVRTLLATLGGLVAGWAIAKGYITQSEADSILSNQQVMDSVTTVVLTLLGSAGAAGVGIWGLVAHKQANVVATVAAMPEVNKVEMVSTAAGLNLAAAVPSAPGSVVTVAPPSAMPPLGSVVA